jgi:hypothetical protein
VTRTSLCCRRRNCNKPIFLCRRTSATHASRQLTRTITVSRSTMATAVDVPQDVRLRFYVSIEACCAECRVITMTVKSVVAVQNFSARRLIVSPIRSVNEDVHLLTNEQWKIRVLDSVNDLEDARIDAFGADSAPT